MNAKQIQKIDGLLEKITTHANKGTPHINDEAHWHIVSSNGWYLRNTGIKDLSSLSEYVRGFLHRVSTWEIEKYIQDLVAARLFGSYKTKDVATSFDNLLSSVCRRTIYKPIFNLEIERDFIFGDIYFHTRKQEEKFIAASVLPPDWQKKNAGNILSWCSMKQDGTKDYAETRFIAEYERYLQVFNFIFHLCGQGHFSSQLVCMPRATGEFISDILIEAKDGNRYSSQSSNSRRLLPIKISAKSIDKISSSRYFKQCAEILRKCSAEECFESRFVIASSFYNESFNVPEDIKLLQSVIGLEALLGTKKDREESRISTNLSEKVAYLCSNEKNQRKRIRKIVKDLYDFRSNIGHGSRRYEEILYAYDAEDVLFWSLKVFLDKLYYGEFTRENELDSWFLDKKMS